MTLNVGDVAQYRTVGRVEILEVLTEPFREGSAGYYAMRFLTGPKRYTDANVRYGWLFDRNKV